MAQQRTVHSICQWIQIVDDDQRKKLQEKTSTWNGRLFVARILRTPFGVNRACLILKMTQTDAEVMKSAWRDWNSIFNVKNNTFFSRSKLLQCFIENTKEGKTSTSQLYLLLWAFLKSKLFLELKWLEAVA